MITNEKSIKFENNKENHKKTGKIKALESDL